MTVALSEDSVGGELTKGKKNGEFQYQPEARFHPRASHRICTLAKGRALKQV